MRLCPARLRIISLVLLGFHVLMTVPAQATFPGQTGSVVFAARGNLFTIRHDGSGPKRLTKGSSRDNMPAWSPRSNKIVYQCNGGFYANRKGDICVVRADGTSIRNLTDSPEYEGSPAWSPDGTQIAFTRRVDSDLPRPASDVVVNTEIFVMGADGRNVRQLTSNPTRDWGPDWSPDGSRIMFSSDRGGSVQVWTMSPEGQDQVGLTSSTDDSWGGSWSPDGHAIAFYRWSESDEAWKVWTITAAGKEQRPLFEGEGLGLGTEPRWSPDGRSILVSSIHKGTWLGLFEINASTGMTRRLHTPTHDVYSGNWQSK